MTQEEKRKLKGLAIIEAFTEKGFIYGKDFGMGYRPENGEHIIFFNFTNGGTFHAVIEESSDVKYRPSTSILDSCSGKSDAGLHIQ